MWFLLFDLKFCQAVRTEQWWNIVATTNGHISDSNSFWIQYRGLLGSSNAYKHFVIWFVFITVSIVYSTVLNGDFNTTIELVSGHVLFLCILMFIMWQKLPAGIVDVFYIRNEIKYFAAILSVSAIIQFIIAFNDSRDTRSGWKISSIMAPFSFCKILYLSFFFFFFF